MPATALTVDEQLTDIARAATDALTALGLADFTHAQVFNAVAALPGFRRIIDRHSNRNVSITLTPASSLTQVREALDAIGVPVLPVAHTRGFPRFLLFPTPTPGPDPVRRVSVAWWSTTDPTAGMPYLGLRSTGVRLASSGPARSDETDIPAILANGHGIPADTIRVFSVRP